MKKHRMFLPLFVFGILTVSSCNVNSTSTNTNINNDNVSIEDVPADLNGEIDLDSVDKASLLVKDSKNIVFLDKALDEIGVESIEPIYRGSAWKELKLKDNISSINVIGKIRDLNYFELVDYNYIVKEQALGPSLEGFDKGNPGLGKQQGYLKQIGVDKLWKWMDKNSPIGQNGKPITQAGGNRDTIVAVVDTGVDYTHPDLIENMWVNENEIPDNGIDDDFNGYIDDYYGWNAVAENGRPMDDHGHGTHCAGIIGMDNNKIGGIGIAYNTRIMPVKCGDSSGAFTSADIAEAITYAYLNGADIISMSVAGPNLSIAVEEAVIKAYNSTFLVAAAGNEALKNEPAYPGDPLFIPQYPASYPYVLGVMSCNQENWLSFFSNWDTKHDNNVEYEIAAPGEAIYSTFPNKQYMSLNGTSMATPVVAGVAALLRSMYPDKDAFPTSFLMSQIAENSDVLYSKVMPWEDYPGVINAYNSIVNAPNPTLSLYDYYAFDDKSLAPENNGDGAIDAGETLSIGVALKNRGGVASNVLAKIDTLTVDGNVDPFIEIIDDTLEYKDIGTYSIREPEKIKDDNGAVVNVKEAFKIKIKKDIPNNYNIVLNLKVTAKNGLDPKDETIYTIKTDTFDGKIDMVFTAHQGMRLPRRVSEDTVFTNDKRYILANNMVIDEGVTCRFEAGCEIEVFEGSDSYYNTIVNSPQIINHGNLIFDGTKEKRIKIAPSEKFEFEFCRWYLCDYGKCTLNYTDITNVRTNNQYIYKSFNSHFIVNGANYEYFNGVLTKRAAYTYDGGDNGNLLIRNFLNSTISGKDTSIRFCLGFDNLENSTIKLLKSHCQGFELIDGYYSFVTGRCDNNIFVQEKEFDFNMESLGDYYPLYLGLKSTVTSFNNNTFINEYNESEIPLGKSARIFVEDGCVSDWHGNNFTGLYKIFKDRLVYDYLNGYGNTVVEYFDDKQDLSLQMPFIESIKLFDEKGVETENIGREEFTCLVKFNRPMEQNEIDVMFGSRRPYSDYKIPGKWISETEWKGSYKITSNIANGTQHFRINGAHAKGEPGLELVETGARYSFSVNMAVAESMNLFAEATQEGMKLTWMQDDYAEVMGYNIYRSEEKDGYYTRLNSTVIPNTSNSFIDENAEPGKTYWYTFTIVTTGLNESDPSPKTFGTMIDTISPNIYHTPINQGYLNSDLIISCNATDNMKLEYVKLYYRKKGASEYQTMTMIKNNDKYTARVSQSNLSLEGLEYYIVASDGVNTITKGDESTPYQVIIKEPQVLSNIGDVNGDGVIDSLDPLMMMQAMEGKIILTDDQFKRADLNKSGVIESVEILTVMKFINGSISSLENVL